MQIRVDPKAEWRQIYHEVWLVERAYFYDPNLHGVNANAEEKRFEPFVASIASRADLNYILQEMLSGFSVGHLRGNGGEIPTPRAVAGGLLGADYTIKDNRYCIAKLYNGGDWNPEATGPLTQPGLNIHVGDCILAIDGQNLTAAEDIQKPLEGTAGHAVTLRVASSTGGSPHDIVVIPTRTEAQLRNFDWIDGNIKKVDQLSGGKLAYVYLPTPRRAASPTSTATTTPRPKSRARSSTSASTPAVRSPTTSSKPWSVSSSATGRRVMAPSTAPPTPPSTAPRS